MMNHQAILSALFGILISSYSSTEAKKVAIIGGGISGTFAAKYLADVSEYGVDMYGHAEKICEV